jgi:hypothetical protein
VFSGCIQIIPSLKGYIGQTRISDRAIGEEMAETFDIYMVPPRDKYERVLQSAFESLLGSSWQLVRVTYSENGSVAEQTPGSLELVLTAKSSIASFRGRGRRWIELTAGFNRSGRVELGSDHLFFEQTGGSIEELRTLFGDILLPVETFVVGDLESILSQTVGISRAVTWRIEQLSAGRRLGTFGFFWIDQLTGRQWELLCDQAPEFEGSEIAVVGETHIIQMWKTPYMRTSAAPKLRALTKAMESSRRMKV